MTDKVFYKAAAEEVVAGKVDSALWIKVNAQMPNSNTKALQAKYIEYRAKELASNEFDMAVSKRLEPWLRAIAIVSVVLVIILIAVTVL
jgi:hypothetical protein